MITQGRAPNLRLPHVASVQPAPSPIPIPFPSRALLPGHPGHGVGDAQVWASLRGNPCPQCRRPCSQDQPVPTCSCGSHKPSATQSQPLGHRTPQAAAVQGLSAVVSAGERDSQLRALRHSLSTPPPSKARAMAPRASGINSLGSSLHLRPSHFSAFIASYTQKPQCLVLNAGSNTC